MTQILRAAALGLVVLGTGAAAVAVLKPDIPDLAVPDAPWVSGSALDGRVFRTTDTIAGTGEVLNDALHFRDGTFQSAMCQRYCDFGWSDYREWRDGDLVHFTAVTRCPTAPHTVVWHGTVAGDSVRFEGTWTTRRWYWTRQMNVSGEGAVAG